MHVLDQSKDVARNTRNRAPEILEEEPMTSFLDHRLFYLTLVPKHWYVIALDKCTEDSHACVHTHKHMHSYHTM